jgi:hypothetical protein
MCDMHPGAIFAQVAHTKDPFFAPPSLNGIGRVGQLIHRRDGRLCKHRIRRTEFITGE